MAKPMMGSKPMPMPMPAGKSMPMPTVAKPGRSKKSGKQMMDCGSDPAGMCKSKEQRV